MIVNQMKCSYVWKIIFQIPTDNIIALQAIIKDRITKCITPTEFLCRIATVKMIRQVFYKMIYSELIFFVSQFY